MYYKINQILDSNPINLKKNLILTASFGKNRNFLKYNLENMKKYAKKTNSDLVVLNDNSKLLKNNQLEETLKKLKIGRGNNPSYYYKIFFVHYYLKYYEKVLWLDDTCYIKEDCEDLFKITKNGSIGAYPEGENSLLKSWRHDYKFIKNNKNFSINRFKYINSGIVVYTQKIRNILSSKNILDNKILIKSPYPHQSILNYLIQKNNIKITCFDEKYNRMFLDFRYSNKNRNAKPKDIKISYLKDNSNKIFHITGYYKNRMKISEHIYNSFKYGESINSEGKNQLKDSAKLNKSILYLLIFIVIFFLIYQ